MLATGVVFAKESAAKIFRPEDLSITWQTYLTLTLAVGVKAVQMALYGDYGKAIDSPALKASAADSRNDMITTGGILVAMVVMSLTGINIDGLVGLAVSVFVIISSIGTIKEQVAPLIGIKPTPERVKMIADRILSYPGVLGIHDLMLHNYGVHNDFVTVHVEMDAAMDVLESHELADRIETDFRDELGISVTIHMDPVMVGNQKLDDIKLQIASVLEKFDPEVTFHDVRMVEGRENTNIILDCVVPPEKGYTAQVISGLLKAGVKSDCNLTFVVEIDIAYC